MKEFEFEKYIVSFRDRMFRYAQSLLLCRDDAEDVVHDLLEHLWTERDKLDRCHNIQAFVMTSVRNRCYDRIRKRDAIERRNDAAAMFTERSTAADAEKWEARDLIRRAMSRLPERQREVLHLKDIEGYPTCEIAEMVDCDQAQVRTILSRDRSGLKDVLKKMMDDERTKRNN